jgi:hypothetical protein
MEVIEKFYIVYKLVDPGKDTCNDVSISLIGIGQHGVKLTDGLMKYLN